jgi:RNA polymerase sigma-70 factor (ECF subfamily)
MSDGHSTCWTVIERAADGSVAARESFARHYAPAVLAYLRARWRGSLLLQDASDAGQEVFVECFRSALGRTDRERTRSFRAFLYGLVRNVARRWEERAARRRERQPDDSRGLEAFAADETALSAVFDRAWAVSVLDRARVRQAERARERGEDAVRRIELLKLRLEDGLPIREIARLWDRDAEKLHRQYARARDEFREALRDVVADEHAGTPAEIEGECARLIAIFR